MRTFLFSLLCFLAFAGTASAAFLETISAADLQAKYQSGTVRILIMPGHEPGFGGAELNGLRERDIAVELSNKLATLLRANPRYEVTVARDTTSWNQELSDYFKTHWKDIQKFVKGKKKEMGKLVKSGEIVDRSFEVGHNTAATDVAYRLYGISKWANEKAYDIAIHVHLNDNTGAQFQSGFAVYVPDNQYGNSAASRAVGESIAYELNHFNASSTLPVENYGIVEDQDLIALGAYNTADFASMLIEYGYIYESKITHQETRDIVLSDMAYQTYRGLQDFFHEPVAGDDTLALPYVWTTGPLVVGSASAQAYALQAALHHLGFYPPAGQLLIGCPISGYVGECTISALKAFQKSKGLEQTGAIGPKTKAALQAAGK